MNTYTRSKAFTLVEITVTIVVIAVLAALAIPRLSIHMERMRVREAVTMLQSVRAAWRQYELDFGAPSDIFDLDIEDSSGMANFSDVAINGGETYASLMGNCSATPCTNNNAWVATTTKTGGGLAYPIWIQVDGTIVCGDNADNSFDTMCQQLGLPTQADAGG